MWVLQYYFDMGQQKGIYSLTVCDIGSYVDYFSEKRLIGFDDRMEEEDIV